MTELGPEWTVGDDGVPWRRAARVLLLAPGPRALLATSHDVDDPGRAWWFTLGGGIEPGESAREAAVREVREESGIELSPEDLVGPVATRSAVLDFASGDVRQEEEYYLARLGWEPPVAHTGWTELERASMDLVCWVDPAVLRSGVEVFPPALADLIERLASGWDGSVEPLR